LSKKKQKNVPPVTEKAPENSQDNPSAPPVTTDGKQGEVQAAQPSPKVTTEQRLERIEALITEHESNFRQVETAFQQLTPLIQLSQQIAEKQKQAAENPQAAQARGGIAVADLLGIAKELGLGGGGNPLGDKLTEQVVEAGLKQMFAGTRLLETMQDKFLSEWGAKTVKDTLAKAESGS